MSLRDDMDLIIEYFKSHRYDFYVNNMLIDIFEGNLKPYVLKELQKTLSEKAFEQIKDRIAPVNVLKKIVDKLSAIYTVAPQRKILNGAANDQDTLVLYEKEMGINRAMKQAASLYSLSRSCLLQPYINNGVPQARSVPNDRFFVLGQNHIDPMKPTHVVTFECYGHDKYRFYAYTDTEFLIFEMDKNIRFDLMGQLDNSAGINPYGAIPFVYANSSTLKLWPTPDETKIAMTLLIPILFSDLNFAVKFQCFSMIYTIDVDSQNLVLSPNAIWDLKSDATSETKPEVGQIKPQVDIDQVLTLIHSEVALWLNSMGLRPGSVGQLTKDSFASGISKLIDESDTYEARLDLSDSFGEIERQFWDLLMNKMNPVWVSTGQLQANIDFDSMSEVSVNYTLTPAAQNRASLVQELEAEVKAGFMSQRMALKKLYPDYSDAEIDALMLEINGEKEEPEDGGQMAEDEAGDSGGSEPGAEGAAS